MASGVSEALSSNIQCAIVERGFRQRGGSRLRDGGFEALQQALDFGAVQTCR